MKVRKMVAPTQTNDTTVIVSHTPDLTTASEFEQNLNEALENIDSEQKDVIETIIEEIKQDDKDTENPLDLPAPPTIGLPTPELEVEQPPEPPESPLITVTDGQDNHSNTRVLPTWLQGVISPSVYFQSRSKLQKKVNALVKTQVLNDLKHIKPKDNFEKQIYKAAKKALSQHYEARYWHNLTNPLGLFRNDTQINEASRKYESDVINWAETQIESHREQLKMVEDSLEEIGIDVSDLNKDELFALKEQLEYLIQKQSDSDIFDTEFSTTILRTLSRGSINDQVRKFIES